MIKKLIKLANHLDSKGLAKEADYLDGIIKRAIDPTTKSINMPGAKDKVKVMFKGNETYDKISKIIAARNLPKTADQYIEDWSEILLKDWDGKESTLNKFLEKPMGKEDKEGISEFLKWFESIIKGGEKVTSEKDLYERVAELFRDRKEHGEVVTILLKEIPDITPAEIEAEIALYKSTIHSE